MVEDKDIGNEKEEEDLDESSECEDDVEKEEDSDIFDEDLAEDLDGESEEVSDFDIGDTILSSAPVIKSWQGENLEGVVGREGIDKDWGSEKDFSGGSFYEVSSSGGDFYGGSRGSDLYNSESGGGLYQEAGKGSDLYNSESGGLYSGKSEGGGMYDPGKVGAKSYGEVADNRRLGRSMLEIAGFEDKEKQRERDVYEVEYGKGGQ